MRQVFSSSSSVTFLFITSRRRCVPASGAKVSPPRRTFCRRLMSSMEKLSARRLGSERLMLRGSHQSSSPSQAAVRCL